MREPIWFGKELYGRFMMGLTTGSFMFLYRSDPILDEIFLSVINNKKEVLNLRYIDLGGLAKNYSFDFDLGNIQYRHIWNSNKWYACLSEGEVLLEGNTIYQWSHKRPSVYVLYKFKKLIDNLTKTKQAVTVTYKQSLEKSLSYIDVKNAYIAELELSLSEKEERINELENDLVISRTRLQEYYDEEILHTYR